MILYLLGLLLIAMPVSGLASVLATRALGIAGTSEGFALSVLIGGVVGLVYAFIALPLLDD